MSLREHEIDLILKWVGRSSDGSFSEKMMRNAIEYAYEIGFTDGSCDYKVNFKKDQNVPDA